MSSLVSCCIWRGFSECPLGLLLSQSLSSSSLSRLLAWVSGLSLGSLRQKYFSLSIKLDEPERKKRRKWSEQDIRATDVSVSKRMHKGLWVHTRNSGKTDFIYWGGRLCTLLMGLLDLKPLVSVANLKVSGVPWRPAKSEIDVSVRETKFWMPPRTRYVRIELKFHTPGPVNRTFGNRTQSNSDHSIDFDWVW